MENFKMVAKTFFGFEEVLAKELQLLGALNVQQGTRMVSFKGDKGFMYKANLSLRTALKILKPIATFAVYNEANLYKGVQSIDWSEYLSANQSFVIDATVFSDNFNNSQFVALKAKDAIVDQFRNKSGVRPSIDKDYPDLRINVHLQKDLCTISLDSSGASLHHRGYRTATNIAPINEVLAAGMLLMSGWDGRSDFMDPMCGSGTVLIEAAMIACNIPPNLMRNEFGFERWGDWDVDLFEKIEESLLSKTRDFHHKIMGFDKSPSAVEKATQNVENAKLEDFIYIKHEDFFKTQKGGEEHLHMVFNPPYGERLDIEMETFYSSIGSTLKHKYPGTNAWMISSNLEALKHVGLRPSRKIKLFNAKLEARFSKYEMYAGTKKTHKLEAKND